MRKEEVRGWSWGEKCFTLLRTVRESPSVVACGQLVFLSLRHWPGSPPGHQAADMGALPWLLLLSLLREGESHCSGHRSVPSSLCFQRLSLGLASHFLWGQRSEEEEGMASGRDQEKRRHGIWKESNPRMANRAGQIGRVRTQMEAERW